VTAQFSSVHVMVCLRVPAGNGMRPQAPRLLGRLRAMLALTGPRQHLSVTYVPDAPGSRWAVSSSREPSRTIGTARPAQDLGGAMQAAWLDQLTREIWHG
jgi:hypothetical protein